MLIGVTGPIGSGTDTFGAMLVKNGFERVSMSDYLREKMKSVGIEINRENMQDFGDKLRKEEGAGILARKLLAKILVSGKKNYVLESVRNPGEVKELKRLDNFVLVLVDAPVEVRFERVMKRARDSDEPQTLEEFKKWEERDFGVGQPEYGQQQQAVFKMADKKIINDGSLENLKIKIGELLREFDEVKEFYFN